MVVIAMLAIITGCESMQQQKDPGELTCRAICDDCDRCEMKCELIRPGSNSRDTKVDNPF